MPTSEGLHHLLDATLAVTVILSLAIAWRWPLLGHGFIHRIERWVDCFAERKTASILGVGALLIAVRLIAWPLDGLPVPRMQDEFSYLLAADTFASGRLANPPIPCGSSWKHFTSIVPRSRG